MSARSRKSKVSDTDSTSSKKEKTKVSTSFSTANTSGIGKNRSSSPLNISRNEEKDELAYLNDRLAGYIDYVRSLENDKEVLTQRLKVIASSEQDNQSSFRQTYERELGSLRSLVDDLANARAKLEIDLKASNDECEDLRGYRSKYELEIKTLTRRVEQLQRELENCKSNPLKLSELKSDLDAMKKKYDVSRKDLDAETLVRAGLENQVTSLREEIEFQNKLLKEERDKISSQSALFEEEVCMRNKTEYESRLAEELRAIRAQTGEELEEYKNEISSTFETKFAQLKAASSESSGDASRSRDELITMRRKYDDLGLKLAQKSSENDMLQQRLDDLMGQIESERSDYESQLKFQREEVRRLNDELQERMREFTELLHTKISLDQEILMYRKMLEGEECRLQLGTPPRDSSFNIHSKKRRLDVDLDDDFMSGSSNFGSKARARYAYQVTTRASGDIEFDGKQDGKGNWVKLINKSNEDVNIGNWALKHMSDGNEVSYKFHRSVNVKAGTTCTIWSSDTTTTHNPPKDLVMKNVSFSPGSNISIRLIDTDDNEQASCTVMKEMVRASYSGRSTSRSSDDKCHVM